VAIFDDQFKQVFRRLARTPLFTTITLLTLAIGIGANTVVFSVVDGVLLKPLNYPHSEQIIGVSHSAPAVNLPELGMGAFMYFTYREQNTSFQDIGCYRRDSLSVTGVGQPEHVDGMDVTDGVLPILGVTPMLGRHRPAQARCNAATGQRRRGAHASHLAAQLPPATGFQRSGI